MWIPSSLYEQAPKYWLFVGLFLIVVSVYLAIEIQQPSMYIGTATGVGSCIWALITYWKRSLRRERSAESPENA